MIRRLAVVILALCLAVLALFVVRRWYAATEVGPPTVINPCTLVPPSDEQPYAHFEQMDGWKIRYGKVRWQGNGLTVDDLAQGRDLFQYDRFEMNDPSPWKENYAMHAKARAFLWRHWQRKRLAYLVSTGHSVDAAGTAHMFIERDQLGRWRIARRIVHGSWTPSQDSVDDAPAVYRVWWAIPQEWDKPGIPLPPGELPNPMKHRLEFSDICGAWQGDF